MDEQEKKPMSIEQVGNYIQHKDFKVSSLKKIEDIKNTPMDLTEAHPSSKIRLMRTALAYLKNNGEEAIYKKLLTCKIKGATDEQIAGALKITPQKVKTLEIEAIMRVKEKLSALNVAPVVL